MKKQKKSQKQNDKKSINRDGSLASDYQEVSQHDHITLEDPDKYVPNYSI